METQKLSVETAKGTISAQVNNDDMFPLIIYPFKDEK